MNRLLFLLGFVGMTSSLPAAPFTLAGLTFALPATWQSVPPASAMRAAQWTIPNPTTGQDAGELAAFYFGSDQGGETSANVARWLRSLTRPDGSPVEGIVTTRTIHGVKITQVTGYGVFASGMPGTPTTPKGGYGLLGAIIEGPEGRVFLKMTGPEALIKSQIAPFTQACDSLSVTP